MKMNNQMDERQVQINIKAMAWGYFFLGLCLIAAMIYNIITTESLGWEFWALIGGCLVTIIARRFLGDVEQPRDIHNRPLPTGSSKEDRRLRHKNYAKESLCFAGGCTALTLLLISFGKDDTADLQLTQLLFPELNHWIAVAISAVLSFTATFVFSYIVDYLVGEFFTLRRYHKMIAQLEEDDE